MKVEADLEGALKRLEAIGPVRRQEPMARHTTFGIGGPADFFAVARSEGALVAFLAAARLLGLPTFLLGCGSNILVGDRGLRGLVLHNEARGVAGPASDGDGSALFRAQSGASLASLARRLARRGLAGLEWAVGIPGSLGGAVVYNAGAYGGSLADLLTRVWVWDSQERVLRAEELALAYRRSAFLGDPLAGATVLAAELRLRPADPPQLLQLIAERDRQRRRDQPRGPNVGSVFKNPPQQPAWWLIDRVGLRGYRIGNAQISPKHTNFIVNLGGARAWQVKALIDLAQQRVREGFGIELEPEVRLVGEGFYGEA